MIKWERIKELRIKCGMTQYEVAKACKLSVGYISKLENGLRSSMSYKAAQSIAKVFGVTPEEFYDSNKMGVLVQEDSGNVNMMRLWELRFKKGVSLQTVADATGIHQSTLSLLETGKRRTTKYKNLCTLANYFHVDPQELVIRGEVYVDLTSLINQSDYVIIEGLEVDVRGNKAAYRLNEALKMGAAWVRDEGR